MRPQLREPVDQHALGRLGLSPTEETAASQIALAARCGGTFFGARCHQCPQCPQWGYERDSAHVYTRAHTGDGGDSVGLRGLFVSPVLSAYWWQG